MKRALGILTLLFISGCGTSVYVNRNPVKDTPSFTVIPVAYNDEEIKYASAVEYEIARTHLRVIERPAFKFMNSEATRTDSTAAGGVGFAVGRSVSQPVKMTDTVAMHEDTKADFIVSTSRSGSRIRIIKKVGGELMVTLKSSDIHDVETFSSQIYAALGAAGFIEGGYDETKCATKSRR